MLLLLIPPKFWFLSKEPWRYSEGISLKIEGFHWFPEESPIIWMNTCEKQYPKKWWVVFNFRIFLLNQIYGKVILGNTQKKLTFFCRVYKSSNDPSRNSPSTTDGKFPSVHASTSNGPTWQELPSVDLSELEVRAKQLEEVGFGFGFGPRGWGWG